ncbi:HupE/UreJ family protein [Aquimarina sp. 2201CG5-10]|uniref:HupE/UreJ family protein n=1 Tax=Aquimarina callyspongiae TaxID=3098150 RepID=UPI002AB58A8C|nr:HupE/UreJ family protein [Aquimarina sp. 2201CG5-10]MDY8136878.1 HupE/UreJ family protein [Aquimarina sp. 2201CG5-10]
MSLFWTNAELGFDHVLDWQAYDHILFLIVLIAAYNFDNWKRIILLVTLFTIGHTISLVLGAYKLLPISGSTAEFLIPITILIAALFNIFTANKVSSHGRYRILYGTTLLFGLIHGVGFSNYFNIISGNLGSKIFQLTGFVIGIEIAQIIIVIIVLLLGFIGQTFLRFSKRDWILVVSSIVIGMVIPMIIENKIW